MAAATADGAQKLKLGISGFGRIGRLTLRAAIKKGVQVVMINVSFNKCDKCAYCCNRFVP